MRRFSQRNSLVTLNDINITPLLDLAFVLLIIFVITRPMLEQSINLNLPKGGVAPTKVDQKNVQTVEITPRGEYKLNGRVMSMEDVMGNLSAAFQRNPASVVAIRADKKAPYEHVANILDACQKRRITQFSFKTSPDKQ